MESMGRISARAEGQAEPACSAGSLPHRTIRRPGFLKLDHSQPLSGLDVRELGPRHTIFGVHLEQEPVQEHA